MSQNWKYEDIVSLPHPVSKTHPQMPVEARAAQFMPFAALTGHAEAIQRTAARFRLDGSEFDWVEVDPDSGEPW